MHKSLENRSTISVTPVLEVLQLRVSSEPFNCGKASHSYLISPIMDGTKNPYFLKSSPNAASWSMKHWAACILILLLLPCLASGLNAQAVAVSGNYVYVADGRSGLQIINVANPHSPSLASSLDTGYAEGVAVSGNYVYVADYYYGLKIINVANPHSPSLASSLDTPGMANGVAVSGNYVYVADSDSGLQIINVANPHSPSLAGSYGK